MFFPLYFPRSKVTTYSVLFPFSVSLLQITYTVADGEVFCQVALATVSDAAALVSHNYSLEENIRTENKPVIVHPAGVSPWGTQKQVASSSCFPHSRS